MIVVPAAVWQKMCEQITELDLPLDGLEVHVTQGVLELRDQDTVYGATTW